MEEVTLQEMTTELGLRRGKNKSNYVEYYCPVHDNDSPDLCIYSDGFCCYSSAEKAAGNAITLLMHVKQMTSLDQAMEWCEDHFPDKEFTDLSEQELKMRSEVRDALNNITEAAHSHLKNEHGQLYEYIKDNRNFSNEVMQKTKIGFISSELDTTFKKRYSKEVLKNTGLYYEIDGQLRCQLWNRIVFPYSRGEQVRYMIGRKPGDHEYIPKPYRDYLQESNAKYKKLKKTDFNKHIIYRWHEDSENTERVLITEGVTDAISAHAAGYNVSSPVTTQYSDSDIEKVCDNAQHFNNVYIIMDADEEGQKGAKKTAQEMAKRGVEASLVTLDEGDLDDYTTENGYDIEGLLDSADLYIDILNDQLADADRRSVTDKKYKIFEAIKSWDEPRRNTVLSSLKSGTKRENKKEFKKWKEKYAQNSEQTEQTEQTEGGKGKQGRVCVQDEGQNDYLKKLASQKVNDKKRLAGQINGTYFLTAWIEDDGLERPAVITSNDTVHFIEHKLKEKQSDLPDDQELSEEQREKYDYWYIEIQGEEVKFQHEIPKKSKQAISNLDNTLLKFVIGEKQLRSAGEIYDDAVDLLGDYWSHYQDEWYDVSIAYDIHTYLLPALGYTVYVLLKGRPQTGKSTWQKVNSQLCYNGCFAGNLTPATAVRYAHSYFATLHQDEMEKQSEERRNQMQGLYNTGQRKGGVYNITNTDNGSNVADQIQEIKSFCAKSMSVNDIYGFADSFMSRNVILKTVKTNEKGLNDPDSMNPEQKKRFKDLQAEMAYYVLKNYDSILDSIEDVRADIEDTARDEDKMALFKGLIKHFKGEERADSVEDRIRDSKRMQNVNKVGQRVTVLFEEVAGYFKEKDSKLVQIRASDLSDAINNELDISDEDEYKATSKSVIRNLKEYDVLRRSNQKKKDSSGYTAVELNRSEFMDACDRYEMTRIYQDLVTTDSLDKEGEDDSKRTHTQGSESKPSQSAQSAQSAQSRRVNTPSEKQILRTVEEWIEEGEYSNAVPISDLEEYFVEAYSDNKKVRSYFEKQPDKNYKEKYGVAKLLGDANLYEPETGKVKPI